MQSRWSGASSGRPKAQPAGGAVRGAGVDQAGRRVGDERGRFARRRVGQAQEGDIGGVEQARAFGRVLALVGVDAQHLDVALREILVDAQAGRAFLAVDKTRGINRREPRCRNTAYGRASPGVVERVRTPCAASVRSQWRFTDIRAKDEENPRASASASKHCSVLGSPRSRGRDRRRPTARRIRAQLRAPSISCRPDATSRARAWTRARSTSWPRASRRRASCSRC